MKTYIKLAWRNLWRNKRRTLITVASIFFGVILSAVMSSMQEGSYEHMVNNAVKFYSGYIQVQDSAYWEKKTINHTLPSSDSLMQKITSAGHVSFATPRLESFALASYGDNTKGAMIMGIAPEMEDRITDISGKVVRGEYLQENDEGVVIGEKLAGFLEIEVGDTLVLLGQGYHGVSAAGIFPVRGIVDHPSPEFDRRIVYMDVGNAQYFYGTGNRLTAIVVMVDDYTNVAVAKQNLLKRMSDRFSVMTWDEMQPTLVQQIESDRASGAIMKGILYMVITFGILGTVMMMVMERKREFGVMIAVGMKRFRLAIVLLFETIFIGMVGVLTGIVASIPVTYYFYENPIPLGGQAAEMMEDFGFEPVMMFSMQPSVFYNQAITILIITSLIAIYPMWRIHTLKAIEALRS